MLAVPHAVAAVRCVAMGVVLNFMVTSMIVAESIVLSRSRYLGAYNV